MLAAVHRPSRYLKIGLIFLLFMCKFVISVHLYGAGVHLLLGYTGYLSSVVRPAHLILQEQLLSREMTMSSCRTHHHKLLKLLLERLLLVLQLLLQRRQQRLPNSVVVSGISMVTTTPPSMCYRFRSLRISLRSGIIGQWTLGIYICSKCTTLYSL